jgi:cellulose synthase/poly-beta-1,6-N-acetylglucosamine synthase-like glycosyltransferase
VRLATALFWLAAGCAVYVYAGYPALLYALTRVFRRPVRKAPITPHVSLLVAAYNEAEVIATKVRNTLALDYPADRLEVVIASDGSTDGTADVAARVVHELDAEDRVHVIDYPQNRGKLAVLNDTVPGLRGDIVAFSDASSMLKPDAMRALVASFADERVGAVSGVYRVERAEHASLGGQEGFYWVYETFLKTQEAALGSILGGHGSLYAIRKPLYPFPPPGTINDDYVIPVRVVQQGFRVAYEPAAVAWEEAHEMGGFSRRVRIMAGNIQQLRELPAFLDPVRPLELFFFLSHKAGRIVVPFALLIAFVANLFLLDVPLYRVLFALQLGFYGLALAGAMLRLPRLLRLPYYFAMINAAAFLALPHAMGSGRLTWRK